MKDLDKKWGHLLEKLEAEFHQDMTLKGILYLIGVQELKPISESALVNR